MATRSSLIHDKPRKYQEDQRKKTYLVEGGLNQARNLAKGWWGMLTENGLDEDLGMKNNFTGLLTGNGLLRKEQGTRKNDLIFTEIQHTHFGNGDKK